MGPSVVNREPVERLKLLKEAILPEPKQGIYAGRDRTQARSNIFV
jgi:hypothetical protein